MKKNLPAPSSSLETDSDTSSDRRLMPPPPPRPSAAAKNLPTRNKEKAEGSRRTSKPVSRASVPAASTMTPAKRSLPLEEEASKKPKPDKVKKALSEGAQEDGNKKPKMDKGNKAVSEAVSEGAQEEGSKSALFQRVWSDEDEIVLLKGMLDYKEKIGSDAMADTTNFHTFVKNSLHAQVDRRQMVDKVRRLKKRYLNGVSKKKKCFTAHEREAFDLSNKIWGHEVEDPVADRETKSDIDTRSLLKTEAGKVFLSASAARNADVPSDRVVEEKNGYQFVGRASETMGLDKHSISVGLRLCREESKVQLEEKWRKLYVEETELFLRKLGMVREEMKLLIVALQSEKK